MGFKQVQAYPPSFVPSEGAVLNGYLIAKEHKEFQGKERVLYTVQVVDTAVKAKAMGTADQDAQEVEAGPGELVALWESASMRGLSRVPLRSRIRVTVRGKVKLKGQANPMWDVIVEYDGSDILSSDKMTDEDGIPF